MPISYWRHRQSMPTAWVYVLTSPPNPPAAAPALPAPQEVAILARCQHPNVVALLGAGSTVGGDEVFLVEVRRGAPFMRTCAARSLRARVGVEGAG